MARVRMKSYVDALFAAQDRAVLAALASQDKRLDGMNEFRQTLTDQASHFASKESVELLRTDFDRRQGSKAGITAAWGYIIGAVGAGAAVVAIVFRLGGN